MSSVKTGRMHELRMQELRVALDEVDARMEATRLQRDVVLRKIAVEACPFVEGELIQKMRLGKVLVMRVMEVKPPHRYSQKNQWGIVVSVVSYNSDLEVGQQLFFEEVEAPLDLEKHNVA